MRLIDADALLMEMGAGCLPIFEKGISEVTGDESTIKDYIDEAPTIDAVEVVRCKDCKHYQYGECGQITYIMDGYYRDTFEVKSPDDFCSRGTKMDAEVEE